MDSDQRLLDDYETREQAREASEWKTRSAELQRYENAARAAHRIRMAASLINNNQAPEWDELHIASKRHLIADAEAVAKNPAITEPELRRLYRERLVASGDTENPDLAASDAFTDTIEGLVLAELRATLGPVEPAA